MRAFALGLTLIFLTACQTIPYSADDAEADSPILTEDRRVFLLSELNRQRAIWNEKRPRGYKYTKLINCFCFPAPSRGPNEISVIEESVIQRIYVGPTLDGYVKGKEITENFAKRDTIQDIFKSVEQHLGPPEERFSGPDNVVNFTVEYDPIWGFPNKIFYDAEQVVDEQYTLTARNFTVIE